MATDYSQVGKDEISRILKEEIIKLLPDYDTQAQTLETQRKTLDAAKTKFDSDSKLVLDLEELHNALEQEKKIEPEALGELKRGIDAEKNRLSMVKVLYDAAKGAIEKSKAEFAQTVLGVKKQLYATEDGKGLIEQDYHYKLLRQKELLDANYLFLTKCESVPELIRDGVDRMFVEALEDKGIFNVLKPMVKQAKELAYIKGKPLCDIMREQLPALGLKPEHVELFAEITQAYERGEHVQYMETLYKEHGIGTAPKTQAATDTPPPKPAAVAAEEKPLLSGIKKLSGKAKLGIAGGTVAVLGAIGAWVWHAKSSKQKQQNTPQEQATAGL